MAETRHQIDEREVRRVCEFTLGDDTFAFTDIRHQYKTGADDRSGSQNDRKTAPSTKSASNSITYQVPSYRLNGTVNLFTRHLQMTVGMVT